MSVCEGCERSTEELSYFNNNQYFILPCGHILCLTCIQQQALTLKKIHSQGFVICLGCGLRYSQDSLGQTSQRTAKEVYSPINSESNLFAKEVYMPYKPTESIEFCEDPEGGFLKGLSPNSSQHQTTPVVISSGRMMNSGLVKEFKDDMSNPSMMEVSVESERSSIVPKPIMNVDRVPKEEIDHSDKYHLKQFDSDLNLNWHIPVLSSFHQCRFRTGAPFVKSKPKQKASKGETQKSHLSKKKGRNGKSIVGFLYDSLEEPEKPEKKCSKLKRLCKNMKDGQTKHMSRNISLLESHQVEEPSAPVDFNTFEKDKPQSWESMVTINHAGVDPLSSNLRFVTESSNTQHETVRKLGLNSSQIGVQQQTSSSHITESNENEILEPSYKVPRNLISPPTEPIRSFLKPNKRQSWVSRPTERDLNFLWDNSNTKKIETSNKKSVTKPSTLSNLMTPAPHNFKHFGSPSSKGTSRVQLSKSGNLAFSIQTDQDLAETAHFRPSSNNKEDITMDTLLKKLGDSQTKNRLNSYDRLNCDELGFPKQNAFVSRGLKGPSVERKLSVSEKVSKNQSQVSLQSTKFLVKESYLARGERKSSLQSLKSPEPAFGRGSVPNLKRNKSPVFLEDRESKLSIPTSGGLSSLRKSNKCLVDTNKKMASNLASMFSFINK